MLAELEGKAEWVWAFQTTQLRPGDVARGVRRRPATPARRTGTGRQPGARLRLIGLLLMAVMSLVGGGISTEMFHALRHADESDPDTISAHLAIYNTMAWVWAGGLLTTGAVALAGIKHGSVSRGLGRFSAVMSGS